MSFHKLIKLANKLGNKYLASNAQGQPKPQPQNSAEAQNIAKIIAAIDALHQIYVYYQSIPGLDPNKSPMRNAAAALHNFLNYHSAIVDNIATYYNPETKQRTHQKMGPTEVAQTKRQILEALPWVSAVAGIIWFNTDDTNIRDNVNRLYMAVSQNAAQISV